jgi:hypothetical protein
MSHILLDVCIIRELELSELSLGSGGRSHRLRFLSSINLPGHLALFPLFPISPIDETLLLISDSFDFEVRTAGQILHNNELASSIDPSSGVA